MCWWGMACSSFCRMGLQILLKIFIWTNGLDKYIGNFELKGCINLKLTITVGRVSNLFKEAINLLVSCSICPSLIFLSVELFYIQWIQPKTQRALLQIVNCLKLDIVKLLSNIIRAFKGKPVAYLVPTGILSTISTVGSSW